MTYLLKNVRVLDLHSSYHNQVVSILVENGILKKISQNIAEAVEVVDLSGAVITPGLVDISSFVGDPGLEHKEDLTSITRVALSGGFTELCLLPNTIPPIQSKSDIKYLIESSKGGVKFHPLGALSEDLKGENLTEILDLNQAGAVGFTDGWLPIWNSELLLKSLQYVGKFEGLIIQRPKDRDLSQFAQMHEGQQSTILGIKGEPSVSEEIMIKRDLDVLKYAGGSIHFSQLSTSEGAALMAKAKKEGLNVSCDVALPNLIHTDSSLSNFDTNYKVDPPLRSESDRNALIKGVNDGVIDVISISHRPQDTESKELEFDLADFGMIGLQTAISELIELQNEIPLEVSLEKLTHSPRSLFNLPVNKIEEGFAASMACFNLDLAWKYDDHSNHSKSSNSPRFGQELKGRCVGFASEDGYFKV